MGGGLVVIQGVGFFFEDLRLYRFWQCQENARALMVDTKCFVDTFYRIQIRAFRNISMESGYL